MPSSAAQAAATIATTTRRRPTPSERRQVRPVPGRGERAGRGGWRGRRLPTAARPAGRPPPGWPTGGGPGARRSRPGSRRRPAPGPPNSLIAAWAARGPRGSPADRCASAASRSPARSSATISARDRAGPGRPGGDLGEIGLDRRLSPGVAPGESRAGCARRGAAAVRAVRSDGLGRRPPGGGHGRSRRARRGRRGLEQGGDGGGEIPPGPALGGQRRAGRPGSAGRGGAGARRATDQVASIRPARSRRCSAG